MSNLSLFDWPGEEEDGRGGGPKVLRVGEVNRAVRVRLEHDWKNLWIEGELSDVSRAATGHVYFVLKDDEELAQIDGVMFRSDVQRARFNFESGLRVQFRGGLSLYEPRGRFQLIARSVKLAGEGELAARFARLRKKLAAAGLFDQARKRPLPPFPRAIGLVTSRHGAALHDIVRVANQRTPVRIVVADCRVQGEGAASTIRAALEAIQRLPEISVVIIGRGGGSAEDLWAFNDEALAHDIANCRVPVVSAVGHESDVTIADLVADLRASTPSNAAELVVPDRAALQEDLRQCARNLQRAMEARLERQRMVLERIRFEDPRRQLHVRRRDIDLTRKGLAHHLNAAIAERRRTLQRLTQALVRHDARGALARKRATLADLDRRQAVAIRRRLGQARQTTTQLSRDTFGHRRLVRDHRAVIVHLAARLGAMSPLSVLSRGYAIAIHEKTGRALRHPADAAPGDRVDLRLAEGRLQVRVEEKSSR